MFSFVINYTPGRGWLHTSIPLYQEAAHVFGRPEQSAQGIEVTYYWPGLNVWTKYGMAIWVATEEDKILWLQMNTPTDAKILDK